MDKIVKDQDGKDLNISELLRDRAEFVFKNSVAIIRLRSKYKGQPLWTVVSDITGHGSTYSKLICNGFGWDADQYASKRVE